MTVATCLMILGGLLLLIAFLGILPNAIIADELSWYIVMVACALIGIGSLLGGACIMDHVNAETEQNTCELTEE